MAERAASGGAFDICPPAGECYLVYGESMSDLHFYFDPVCPFAWVTSKWVRKVAAQRGYQVDWRFISLRLLNAHVDYDAQFPPGYVAGHTAGLHLLRVAAKARADHGREAMSPLYDAFGTYIFDVDPNPADVPSRLPQLVHGALERAGLPLHLVTALDDSSWDAEIRGETDEALQLTGKDVGTPILHFEPPMGAAFFGPVISRVPSDADSLELWDHVVGLARFPGFAELKRSMRERPQLRALGVPEDGVGQQEDWHRGSRRVKQERAAQR